MYNAPALLAAICDDPWESFEEAVNPGDELGACAVHMVWQESTDLRLVQIEPPVRCHRCAAILDVVFPGDGHDSRQLQGALWVAFRGGYGMFVDNVDKTLVRGQPDFEAVLCSGCADALCDAVPWIAALLQAH